MDAVVFEEGQGVTYYCVDRKYEVANIFKAGTGKQIIIREYLNSDEDGQTFVEYTRLLDVI